MKKFSIFNFQFSNSSGGVTLFIAVTIMAILLFVSFAVISVAVKSTLFANSAKDSQMAFFASDAGLECAIYWDVQDPNPFKVKMSTFADYYISEFSGIERNLSPLDKHSNKIGYLAGQKNELVHTNSVNTAIAKELLVGWLQEAGNGPVTEGPGYAHISYLRSNVLEYKVVSSAGTYDASGYFKNNGKATSNYMADIVTFKAASGETPAFVQSNDVYIDDLSNPVELTFPNPSATGDFIMVNITYNKDTYSLDSISDNKGNTYTRAHGPVSFPDSPWSSEVWYAKDITGGGSPITITAHSPAFVPVDVHCNAQTIASGLGGDASEVKTTPAQAHCIGGSCAEANGNTSIFQLNFSNDSCAIVRVTKNADGTTHLESRGYNTCSSSGRRVERGIEMTY